MNIVNFLPLSIYEFTCDDVLLERIASAVKDLKMVKNIGNERTETDLFYDRELYEWFDNCIGEAKDHLYIPKEVELAITCCWANKARKLQIHHKHAHSNSFMSGIFYLSDGHSGGITEFITENLWWTHFKWLKFNNSPNIRTISQTYKPQKGNLLLFPSSLTHNVSAMLDDSTRYTISFNTFFSGSLDFTPGTRLEIHSKSVSENNEA